MGITEGVIIAVLSTIGGWLGGFFGSYAKKKGENLATHEDIDKLVVQMTATTEATKAIEARIDDQVWDRQRQWELRKETIIEVVKTIGKAEFAIKHAIVSLGNMVSGSNGISADRSTFGKDLDECIEYLVAFDGLRLMMSLIVDAKTLVAFSDMKEAFYKCVCCLDIKNFDKDRAKEAFDEFVKLLTSFQVIARQEMGVPIK